MSFIGFYDYTVVLTFLSLFSAVFGIAKALQGDFTAAIVCLGLCGFCDAFDGRVARSKKNRTEDEKNYGIQLDSLCDVICFGFYPALICYLMGVRGVFGLVLVFFYCGCAVSRLAFFNVLEANRQKQEGGCNKNYRGLPVTSISMIFPLVFVLRFFIAPQAFLVILYILLPLVGFLFILDFSLRKPGLKGILIMGGIVAVILGSAITFARLRNAEPEESPEWITEECSEETYGTESP